MKNLLTFFFSLFYFTSLASAGGSLTEVASGPPWYEQWVCQGQWVRNDAIIPVGESPAGANRYSFRLPQLTDEMGPSDRIVFKLESFQAVKWKWENTDPVNSLIFDGSITINHAIYMRGEDGQPVRLTWHPATYVTLYSVPYTAMGGYVLGPFDGQLDAVGSSGFLNTCPGSVPGAESEFGTTCHVQGGLYAAEGLNYVTWGDLGTNQKRSFRDGAVMFYQPTFGTFGTEIPWHNTHGWWNDSDFRVDLKASFWVDNN